MTDDATSFDHDDDRVVGRTDHCGWMGEVTERGGGEKIKEIRKHPPEHGSKETTRRDGVMDISHTTHTRTNFSIIRDLGRDRDEVDWWRNAVRSKVGSKRQKKERTTQCLRFFKHCTLLAFTFPSCSRAE